MEIILVANEKGGTGKTSTVLCLANALKTLGYRVLAVDFDPSGNLSNAMLQEPPEHVIYDVFRRRCSLRDAISHTDIADILPTVRELAELNGAANDLEEKSLNQLANAWVGKRGAEYLLSAILRAEENDLESLYDFVIIDSAPSDSIIVTNAIVAADKVLMPCEPSLSSQDGIHMFLNSVIAAHRYYTTQVQVEGIILTKYSQQYKSYRESLQGIAAICQQFHIRCYRTKMRMSANMPAAAESCRPIMDYLHLGSAASDALNLALEFLCSRNMEPKVLYPGVHKEDGTWIFQRS
ncbi:MAG TPA: ParA family protein [Candidatus Faecousia intestinigallinarum]|nr:ParA family protein [Candidatus Faecousia intestinigallinarum]